MRIQTTISFLLATGFACGSTPLGDYPGDPCAIDPMSRGCLDRRITDAGPTPDAGPTVDAGPDAGPVDAGPPPPVDAGPRPCRSAGDCARDEFCEQAIGICNPTPSPTGTCKPRPFSCPAIYDPVCGCDGRDYKNPCVAYFSTGIAESGTCGRRLCPREDDAECLAGTYCYINDTTIGSFCRGCSNLTRHSECAQHATTCSWVNGHCTTHIEPPPPPPPFDAGVCERKLLDTCMAWTDCIPGGGCTAHDNCGTGLFCENEPNAGLSYCTQVCQNDSQCGTGNVCRDNRCTRACNTSSFVNECEAKCGGGTNGFYCQMETAGGAGACMLGIM